MEAKENGAPSLSEETPPKNTSETHSEDNKEDCESNASDQIVYNAVELMRLAATEPKYLLNPILAESGIGLIAGKPDIGKSQLGRNLCVAIVYGLEEFLSFKLVTKHKSAIYISTEDNAYATQYQLDKQLKGLSKDPIDRLRFIFAEGMAPKEILSKLKSELQKAPADLVIVDSFGDIFDGSDSNGNIQMRKSVQPYSKIAKANSCLILFIHHINKAAYRQAPGQEHIQGGSGLVQKVRVALFLSEGEGNTRYLSIVKGNYTSKKFKQNSMILNFSEETLLFTNTGSLKPTVDIGNQTVEKNEEKYNVLVEIAQTIFKDKQVTYGKFVEEYCEISGKSTPTAKRVHCTMKELGLIHETSEGYKLSNPIEVLK
ncbi:MAG: AAA family ATPase [Cyclobacteriaceae bacterium]